jgi:hypothetical protein
LGLLTSRLEWILIRVAVVSVSPVYLGLVDGEDGDVRFWCSSQNWTSSSWGGMLAEVVKPTSCFSRSATAAMVVAREWRSPETAATMTVLPPASARRPRCRDSFGDR